MTPKISIIMQVYLGEYPGSRTNSIDKFIRAVNSFLNQSYKNTELIIVSDGCLIAHDAYYSNFTKFDNIRYAFVEKKGIGNMYDEVEGTKFYRGIPRQIGVELSSGDLITYMDSDDYLLSNFTKLIIQEFNKNPNLDFYSNAAWFDNQVMEFLETDSFYPTDKSKTYVIEGLEDSWVISQMKPGMITMAPWLFIHKKVDDIRWRDTTETSEDVDFNTRFRKIYKNGIQIVAPSYVRCHFANAWDF